MQQQNEAGRLWRPGVGRTAVAAPLSPFSFRTFSEAVCVPSRMEQRKTGRRMDGEKERLSSGNNYILYVEYTTANDIETDDYAGCMKIRVSGTCGK